MYELYYYPGNASLAPHLVLEAIGAPYELVVVDRNADEQKSESYTRLNPMARIPTLVHDGVAVWESAAIVLLLSETHPDTAMAPTPLAPERGAFLQWLMFFTNTLQPALMDFHYPDPEEGEGEGKADLALGRRSPAAVCGLWKIVDQHLPTALLWRDRPERGLSALGCYCLMLVWWSRTFRSSMKEFESLNAFIERAFADPTVRAVFEQEGLVLEA